MSWVLKLPPFNVLLESEHCVIASGMDQAERRRKQKGQNEPQEDCFGGRGQTKGIRFMASPPDFGQIWLSKNTG